MSKLDFNDIQKAQAELKSGINPLLCDIETNKYLQNPIGKALYTGAKTPGRPKKDTNEKAKQSDRIKCKICGKEFTRSCRTSHNKTKHHKLFGEMSEKMIKIMLDKK